MNYGVQPSKSTTKQVTDHCAMLEAYAEVDKKLAQINNNTAAWRLGEDMAFLEAMNQAMADVLFYGDETSPEKFVGLAPRYAELTGVDSAGQRDQRARGFRQQADLTVVRDVGPAGNARHFPEGFDRRLQA